MPTDLGQPYPPTWQGYPPHMSTRDLLIWRNWFPGIARTVQHLFFDVGLGPGPVIPPRTPAPLAKMWTRLNQKRADVILERDADVVIVELRSMASASAIGRLLLYRQLYLQDPVLGPDIKTWLVTDIIDDPTRALAEEHGIEVTAVP